MALINSDTVKTIISICVLFGFAFGAITYFATAEDVEFLAMRLDQKILDDKIFVLQQRIWQLEDRYPGQANCTTWHGSTADRDREEYRRLLMELNRLKKLKEGMR